MIVLNEEKLEKIIEYKCIQAVTTITKHWDYKGTKKMRKKQKHNGIRMRKKASKPEGHCTLISAAYFKCF